MRVLRVHQIYKHFKGKKYIVIGISKPAPTMIQDKLYSVHHTELEKNIGIEQRGTSYYHHESVERKILVIYKQLSLDPRTFAREINMFLSEVNHKKYPKVKQKYRFEEVK